MLANSIDDVIAKLTENISWAKANNSRLGYFASLYKRMTIAVKNGIDAGIFEDAERMKKLDVIFANRYLEAFDNYQKGKSTTHCWMAAFEATKNSKLTAIQHLILGINAHINLDLGIAAAQTVEPDKIQSLKNDFNSINKVIAGLVDEVQDELSAISLPLKFLDRIANDKDEAVISFSISIARKQAWRFAENLSTQNDTDNAFLINQSDKGIKMIADKIIKPGLWTTLLIKLIKRYEPKNIGVIIDTLNRHEA